MTLDKPMTWKYRGQVVPENRHVVADVEITNGSLWVDGKRIYEAIGLAMRIVDDAPPRPPGSTGPGFDRARTKTFWRDETGTTAGWGGEVASLVPGAITYERERSERARGSGVHGGERDDTARGPGLAPTRAGAADERGRETLLKYILRPPIAQERITRGPDGLVRIALKKAFSDGTVAVDLDPLSLLTRLCAAVPAPRFRTVRYVGLLASASKLRPRIVPTAKPPDTDAEPVHGADDDEPPRERGRYRPWAELLRRTFAFDVLACGHCGCRLRLVAMMTEAASITRYLRAVAEPTDPPTRASPRGPPYWASRALRRHAGDLDAA